MVGLDGWLSLSVFIEFLVLILFCSFNRTYGLASTLDVHIPVFEVCPLSMYSQLPCSKAECSIKYMYGDGYRRNKEDTNRT